MPCQAAARVPAPERTGSRIASPICSRLFLNAYGWTEQESRANRYADCVRAAQASKAGEPVLLHERAGPIAVLTLNRPQQRNSLSEALIAALAAELSTAIAADGSVRAVVIAANGPAFCAGHDLKELTAARAAPDRGRAMFERVMNDCAAMMQAIVALPHPVIAAVNGVATAAGCQLVASCDLAVASSDARFATPGVDIGLFCSTPMVALTRNVARKHAMEMLLTGNLVAAEQTRSAWA